MAENSGDARCRSFFQVATWGHSRAKPPHQRSPNSRTQATEALSVQAPLTAFESPRVVVPAPTRRPDARTRSGSQTFLILLFTAKCNDTRPDRPDLAQKSPSLCTKRSFATGALASEIGIPGPAVPEASLGFGIAVTVHVASYPVDRHQQITQGLLHHSRTFLTN